MGILFILIGTKSEEGNIKFQSNVKLLNVLRINLNINKFQTLSYTFLKLESRSSNRTRKLRTLPNVVFEFAWSKERASFISLN